jgi:hypothetical protein
MKNYIILANPGHNRIYLDAAMTISAMELQAMSESMDMGMQDIHRAEEGLPAAIAFSVPDTLNEDQLSAIGTSSIYYALFEVVGDGLLKPLPVPDFHTFPESMVQILKYNGKTNEQFTRLMVNLAMAACETHTETKTLFDPMAGKGTTLFEGLIRGLDVKGVELHDKWAHEAQVFLLRFMTEGLYKHKSEKGNRNDEKGRKFAGVFKLTCAADSEDYKHGKTQSLELYATDTRNSDLLIKGHSCDMLVCDLPYGVQHGSKTSKKSRSPLELLDEALPAWSEILKNKGSMVLAFNEHTLNYHDIARLLEAYDYRVLTNPPYTGFSHRVDQSIKRNLIVAVKI